MFRIISIILLFFLIVTINLFSQIEDKNDLALFDTLRSQIFQKILKDVAHAKVEYKNSEIKMDGINE